MKTKKENQTLTVLLCCGCGVVAAVLHWLIPTRILMGNALEYTAAAVAAVLSLGALFGFVLCFVLPLLQQKRGLCGGSVFYMPALCWTVLGLLFGAAATVAKLIRALIYTFVPPQSDGTEHGFWILTLVNVPVLLCFAVLYLREQKLQRN